MVAVPRSSAEFAIVTAAESRVLVPIRIGSPRCESGASRQTETSDAPRMSSEPSSVARAANSERSRSARATVSAHCARASARTDLLRPFCSALAVNRSPTVDAVGLVSVLASCIDADSVTEPICFGWKSSSESSPNKPSYTWTWLTC